MRRRTTIICLSVLIVFGGVMLQTAAVFAAQGLTPSGPIGGTDISQAIMPPPGLYGGAIFGNINYIDWKYEDDVSIDMDRGTQFYAAALSYVYDTKIFGGSLLSSAFVGYQQADIIFAGMDAVPFKGAMDLYTDLFFWSKFYPSEAFLTQPQGSFIPYGIAVGGGLGVTWPTGTYYETDIYNVGSNFYTVSPSVAFTWTIPGIFGDTFGKATQFSTRCFYNYYTENEDAGFTNGSLISNDFSFTQIFGDLQVGLSGNVFYQLEDDEFSGSTYGVSNKTKSLNLGLVAAYNFMLGDHFAQLKIKTGDNVWGENVANTELFVVSLGVNF